LAVGFGISAEFCDRFPATNGGFGEALDVPAVPLGFG
jgi:hypothetical protein